MTKPCLHVLLLHLNRWQRENDNAPIVSMQWRPGNHFSPLCSSVRHGIILQTIKYCNECMHWLLTQYAKRPLYTLMTQCQFLCFTEKQSAEHFRWKAWKSGRGKFFYIIMSAAFDTSLERLKPLWDVINNTSALQCLLFVWNSVNLLHFSVYTLQLWFNDHV